MRVVVFGATGYIGSVVVRELAARGHKVLAFTRDEAAVQVDGGDVQVVVGDVTSTESVRGALAVDGAPIDAAVCCLASRSGGPQDSFDIDYEATMNCARAAADAKISQFVLLSAVCVQRPKLKFQEAKLQAEEELQALGKQGLAYSIVRPTAFFKSILGQVKAVKGGAPYVMFGDGTSVRCKPISEQDLAAFIADCLWDPAKKNAILPVGGPGPALSFQEQGQTMFKILGKEPAFISVPYVVFDVVQGILDFLASLSPDLSDLAEYGRIGRYYAEESMLVLDPSTEAYSEELTPSYGKTSFRDFLEEALSEGSDKMASQELREQGLGSRLGFGDS